MLDCSLQLEGLRTVIWTLQARNGFCSCTVAKMLTASLIEVQTMAVFYIIFPYMLPWLKAVKRRRLMIHVLFWLQATTFLAIASWLQEIDCSWSLGKLGNEWWPNYFQQNQSPSKKLLQWYQLPTFQSFHSPPLSFFSLVYWPWKTKRNKQEATFDDVEKISWGSGGLLRYWVSWIQRVLLDRTCLATKPNPCLCYGMPFGSGAHAWWRCKVDVMTLGSCIYVYLISYIYRCR